MVITKTYVAKSMTQKGHKGCASTANRKDDALDIPHVNIPPFLLYSPPQLCLILWAIWPVINRSLQLCPRIINLIYIRRF